jgi:alkylhydroperoxidase/carboxymuconolactone decarboxylase family protein YurZ
MVYVHILPPKGENPSDSASRVQGKAAREAGATDPMLAEVATVAAAMRAGAAITHATHLF